MSAQHLGSDVMAYFRAREAQDPKFALLVQEERAKLVLARSLRDLRKERGLSRGQLAKEARTKRSIIRALERGKASPKLKVLWRIIIALDVTLSLQRRVATPQDLENTCYFCSAASPTRTASSPRWAFARCV